MLLAITSSPRRYSYALVLAAVVVGLLTPAWAGWLLGVLLLPGLVLLGVAHGACDQYVLPATHPALAHHRGRYWGAFLLTYLGLAAAVGGLWWWQPTGALVFFLVLSAWHWGSADAPPTARTRAQWVAHSLLRGSLLFAVPLLGWPVATRALLNDLLLLTNANAINPAAVRGTGQALGLVVVAGHGALWGSYLRLGQPRLAITDLGEALLLTVMLVVLPPLLSAGVYFVGWHSLQHVLRMHAVLPADRPLGPSLEAGLRVFGRRAAPLLLVSVGALLAVYGWVGQHMVLTEAVLVSLGLLLASVVTLPHALLVTLGLDADQWRPARVRATSPSQPS